MYSARVTTNETCNHDCAFCDARRSEERASVAGSAVVRKGIDEAIAAGARELTLTGGEPTLRKDLAAIVQYAARAGAGRIAVETNAALIDGARARQLAAAGLAVARVHVPAWGTEADAITRDDGGFAAMRAGVDALVAAGIELELSVPIVRANRGLVARIPALVAAEALPVAALVVVLPIRSPQPDALLPLADAAAVAEELARRARDVGMTVRFDTNTFVPPCAFPTPRHVAHMYSMTPGGTERPRYARDDDCAGCLVADRCPGVPEGIAFPRHPIREDRMRRRLSVISTVNEQIERELVAREITRGPNGAVLPVHTVRVNFHCNQACRFCFVSTHLPAAEDAAIRAAILEVSRAGGQLALSGGEPTLNPRLVEYVKLGVDNGAREVELQTNAIRLGDAALVRQLVDAGLTHALVSLHASNADISDAITDAPGTFDKTVAGLDQLAKTSLETRVNFVFCEANRLDFPRYVDLVSSRWPTLGITVSFVASSTDVVPRTREMMPRYSEVLPALYEGLEKASAVGIRVCGFESMCGVPLCLVPHDMDRHADLAALPDGIDGGEFLKPEPCGRCALEAKCYGLRRGYAALHGWDELRPVTA